MLVKLSNANCMPKRAHPTDAGADLVSREDVFLSKGKRTLIPTGVFVEIPHGYVGLLVPRSSLSKRNIVMTNSVGIIDAEYRGEIMASLMYLGDNSSDFASDTHQDSGGYIAKYERIVQLVIVPVLLADFTVVDELSDTVRGTGGFGSTG